MTTVIHELDVVYGGTERILCPLLVTLETLRAHVSPLASVRILVRLREKFRKFHGRTTEKEGNSFLTGSTWYLEEDGAATQSVFSAELMEQFQGGKWPGTQFLRSTRNGWETGEIKHRTYGKCKRGQEEKNRLELRRVLSS